MTGGSQGAAPRAVVGEFEPIPGTMKEYELGSDFTRIFADPPRGIIMHFAGPIGDSVLSGSVWISQQAALDFFAERVGEALVQLVKELTRPERDPDISYGFREVVRFEIGPAAEDFVLRPRGEANGAVLIRGASGGMPAPDDPELIAAFAVERTEGEFVYEFRTSPPDGVAGDAEVIHLHSLFTSAPALDQLAATRSRGAG